MSDRDLSVFCIISSSIDAITKNYEKNILVYSNNDTELAKTSNDFSLAIDQDKFMQVYGRIDHDLGE